MLVLPTFCGIHQRVKIYNHEYFMFICILFCYWCGYCVLNFGCNLTGDLERKFDLEISPLCNQQADSVPAIQIGEYQSAYYTVYCIITKMLLSSLGDDPPLLCVAQGSSPTSWSLCSKSGTASPSPARSARPWLVTCTRTRHAGAAYDTHAHPQTRKHTPTPRSPKGEEERGKTSLNLALVSQGIWSSFVNGGEEC